MRATPDWLTAPLNPTSYRDDFWIPWQLERLAGYADSDREIDDMPRAAARECRRSQCRRARTCQKGMACKDEKMRWHLRDIAYEAEMAEEAKAAAAAERKAAPRRSRSRREAP
jgi:hypothetical protein